MILGPIKIVSSRVELEVAATVVLGGEHLSSIRGLLVRDVGAKVELVEDRPRRPFSFQPHHAAAEGRTRHGTTVAAPLL